ncbi:hypothetical protein BYT27DRAFT_7186533 [Phlegmacium glaucopus]|nr:hypothetical protein BYT27DRAFT_7186533 [Phlegmacium glaucopus]
MVLCTTQVQETPLPLNTPTRVELSAEETIVITLLDARHCPGAVMFQAQKAQSYALVTSVQNPGFLSLTRNSLLQRYLSPRDQEYVPSDPKQLLPTTVSTTLEVIYLNTPSALSDLKAIAREFQSQVMSFFTRSRYSVSWIWIDKHSIYHHISDPFLGLITTRDPSSTRFHACKRFLRCSFVAVDNDTNSAYPNSTSHMGRRVVYINPVTMGSEK